MGLSEPGMAASDVSVDPSIPVGNDALPESSALVESRMGAVAWGHWPAPRFPSLLIEPDVPSYRIRLSDWLRGLARPLAASTV
jgi:hypothetical protein